MMDDEMRGTVQFNKTREYQRAGIVEEEAAEGSGDSSDPEELSDNDDDDNSEEIMSFPADRSRSLKDRGGLKSSSQLSSSRPNERYGRAAAVKKLDSLSIDRSTAGGRDNNNYNNNSRRQNQ